MKHKKLYLFTFSFIILIGLCIGVFADSQDFNLVGYYSYTAPYNTGEVVLSVTNSASVVPAGHYYWHFHINERPSTQIGVVGHPSASDQTYAFYYVNDTLVLDLITSTDDVESFTFPFDGNNDLYIYFIETNPAYISYSSSNSGGEYISVDFYSINDITNIDVYQNSQDVWTNIVSTVTTGTNTILDNDILLLFAAALPIVSFGAGMLIRLFRKS